MIINKKDTIYIWKLETLTKCFTLKKCCFTCTKIDVRLDRSLRRNPLQKKKKEKGFQRF